MPSHYNHGNTQGNYGVVGAYTGELQGSNLGMEGEYTKFWEGIKKGRFLPLKDYSLDLKDRVVPKDELVNVFSEDETKGGVDEMSFLQGDTMGEVVENAWSDIQENAQNLVANDKNMGSDKALDESVGNFLESKELDKYTIDIDKVFEKPDFNPVDLLDTAQGLFTATTGEGVLSRYQLTTLPGAEDFISQDKDVESTGISMSYFKSKDDKIKEGNKRTRKEIMDWREKTKNMSEKDKIKNAPFWMKDGKGGLIHHREWYNYNINSEKFAANLVTAGIARKDADTFNEWFGFSTERHEKSSKGGTAEFNPSPTGVNSEKFKNARNQLLTECDGGYKCMRNVDLKLVDMLVRKGVTNESISPPPGNVRLAKNYKDYDKLGFSAVIDGKRASTSTNIMNIVNGWGRYKKDNSLGFKDAPGAYDPNANFDYMEYDERYRKALNAMKNANLTTKSEDKELNEIIKGTGDKIKSGVTP